MLHCDDVRFSPFIKSTQCLFVPCSALISRFALMDVPVENSKEHPKKKTRYLKRTAKQTTAMMEIVPFF
jgi:hypothetical protein